MFVIQLREQHDSLNVISLLTPETTGQGHGLLGNITTFTYRNGSTFIITTDDNGQAQFVFGETWRLNKNETLFYYVDTYEQHQNL
ncbi:unnamed protein product [Didymodactylos carnosus]|uniref:Uncharacterized protein n=1 Tax=Didymodactylos carnosus TaxID=1234261 RepID=A0A814F0S9_9BILA|nr:unnamed protein product [Didymodactylos carnosus]CAF3752186.1 unnamed protein product [Didymodactylos carnosus]